MIHLSNKNAQTLAPGGVLTFDDVLLHCGSGECFRNNTGSVKLRANGVYQISFSGNINGATAAAPAQLVVALGDAPLVESTMKSSATGFNNVATTIPVKNCCGDYDRITIKNNGTVPVVIDANSSLYIKRES